MRRLLVVLALFAAACGGVDVSQGVSPSEPVVDGSTGSTSAAEVAADSTSAVQESSDPTSAAEEATDEAGDSADGRPAPEFVLALGEGGEFSPSSEDKPIYMVFWAEW
jgi:hypothetical protein